MGSVEDLPPDQRAVLQMVLQRGRSYDEIAGLLSIDRAAVRQRALDGCLALTPDTVLAGPEQALVTDYLLRQLPDQVAEQVYAYLEAAEADREWAHAVSEQLIGLAARPLPDIPENFGYVEDDFHTPPSEAEDQRWEGVGEEAFSWEEPSQTPTEPAAAAPESVAPVSAPAGADTGLQAPSGRAPRDRRRLPLSGWLAVIVVAVVAVVVVVVIIGSSGSSSPPHTSTVKTTTVHNTTPATTTTASTTTSTTTPQILAALNLTSPNGATKTLGVAQVIREGKIIGIVIDAQGVPANGAHNAYAVWLYNSPTSSEFVGFVKNLVGKDGKLEAEGELPSNATDYSQVLITLETQSNPKTPGQVVLSGPFREHT